LDKSDFSVIRIIPTIVNFSDYDIQNTNDDEETVAIGWIGESKNQVYLNQLKDVFKSISAKYPNVILKIISNKPFTLTTIPVANIKWSINDYKSYLYQIDIGIMPLKDDDWSKGKCAFKLIQYMAAGLPVIASDIGANASVITDSVDGYLVKSDIEWIEKLKSLIESSDLRAEMGNAGRIKIKKHFSVEAWGERVERIYLDRLG